MTDKNWINVGTIANTHGIKGEVKIWPQTDFPHLRFKVGAKLWVFLQTKEPREMEIVGVRPHKNIYVIRLKGVENKNQAEEYKGAQLKVRNEDRAPLQEGQYYVSDIIGCDVITEAGLAIGRICEVLTPGAHDVWVVKREQLPDLLLPVIDEVVQEVNLAKKKIIVTLLEGLT